MSSDAGCSIMGYLSNSLAATVARFKSCRSTFTSARATSRAFELLAMSKPGTGSSPFGVESSERFHNAASDFDSVRRCGAHLQRCPRAIRVALGVDRLDDRG